MEFENFLQKIKEEGIEQKTGFAVEVREVLKNNGVRLHGLILEDGKAVRPNVFLKIPGFWMGKSGFSEKEKKVW